MKYIKALTIAVFFCIIAVPVITFKTSADAVSEIDNRKLADFPPGIGHPKALDKYVNDRIGLRDKMILTYTLINDQAFGKMVHPTYTYGKDGYIFFRMEPNRQYDEYFQTFVDMIEQIQVYCDERDVPFVFVFNPEKDSVLSEYLPKGVNYDDHWIDTFMSELEKRNIHYVNNLDLFKEINSEQAPVFNQKYDAGHWNELGAFYGVNHVLQALKKDYPNIHINSLEDFNLSYETKESLPSSEFPIHERIPVFTLKTDLIDKTKEYDAEVVREKSHSSFGYFVNPEVENSSPKTLVFQGSHMNNIGNKFLKSSLGEYIWVHNYQNVINFSYYFNIFKPDCVIFEVAQYAMRDGYFSQKNMKKMDLNPPVSKFQLPYRTESLVAGQLTVHEGDKLVSFTVQGLPESTKYAWLMIGGQEFDLLKQSTETDGVYEASIDKAFYDADNDTVQIITVNQDSSEMITFSSLD